MINRVGKFLDDYIKAGSDIITFHIEIEENLSELIGKIKDKNIKAGIAIKPKTPWEEIKSLLHSIDQVIIMTVEPGFGGQSFMSSQINKIKSISNYIKENNLSVDIEIDGGVHDTKISNTEDRNEEYIMANLPLLTINKLEIETTIFDLVDKKVREYLDDI